MEDHHKNTLKGNQLKGWSGWFLIPHPAAGPFCLLHGFLHTSHDSGRGLSRRQAAYLLPVSQAVTWASHSYVHVCVVRPQVVFILCDD